MNLQMPEFLTFNIFHLLKYLLCLNGLKALTFDFDDKRYIGSTKPILNVNVVLIMVMKTFRVFKPVWHNFYP